MAVPTDMEEAIAKIAEAYYEAIKDRLGADKGADKGAEISKAQLSKITILESFYRYFKSGIVPGIALAL